MNSERHPFFNKQSEEIANFFENWFYRTESSVFELDGEPLKKSLYCELHDIFLKHFQDSSQKGDDYAHNCIGCNLEHGGHLIRYFLNTNKNCDFIEYYLTNYTLLFYLQAEKIGVVYNQLGISVQHRNGPQFDWEKFPNLRIIKNWANFFKHPKSYMFLHHPTYHIETDPDKPNFMISESINSDFVNTYYSGNPDNQKLFEFLANKENVKIFFPDLVELTKKLCDEFEKIITTIKSDQKHVEKLSDFTHC